MASHLPCPYEICDIFGGKYRNGIIGAEWGEFLNIMVQFRGNVTEGDAGVYIDLWSQHILCDSLPNNLFKFLFERLQVFQFQCQSRCIFVPSVIF